MERKKIQESILANTFGDEKCWVNWKYEKDKNGRDTKVPYQIDGVNKASTTNPSTWNTYEKVAEASENIGIVFSPDGLLLGIDIDHCLVGDKIVHEKSHEIERFIYETKTYFEISPSGTGLHAFLKLTEPLKLERNKQAPFELYTSGRYFTVTNKPYCDSNSIRTVTPKEAVGLLSIIGYPWQKNEKEKKNIITIPISLDDETLLSKMFSSKNGDKIKSLHDGDISQYGNDDSSADMALCSHLAFWTGRNTEQMERIWLSSPLGMREKTLNRKDYRERTISKAIEECSEIYSSQKKDDSAIQKDIKENSLLEDFINQKDLTLFHDEKKNAFVALNISGHREIWSCRSKTIKILLAKLAWEKYKKPIGSESLKSMVNILEGKAHFDGPEIKLHNRVAWHGGCIWYDLTNEDWGAVRIGNGTWSIEEKPPILFKRYSHNLAQDLPSDDGHLCLFLEYVNIKNKEHQLLLLIYLVTCFIPGFPHVMLAIFGSQGSSKSTLLKLLRLTVDPSLIDVASFPHTQKELVQTLAHNYLLPFDNVSYISEDQSDTLCKAITGGGHVKRELYENDEDVIYNFMRCISINGINLVTTRPDLLERSLLIELERIEPKDRKTEAELYENFKDDLPEILGGIFQILTEAQKIYPTIKLDSHPRMADWTLWGCAIAEAMGHKKEEFLDIYQNNINRQTEMLINENIVATAIITFMEGKDNFKATPTDLLQQLSSHASFIDIDTREKYWPKGASILSRRLNELSTPLKQMGLSVIITTNGMERIIDIQRIKNIPKKIDDNDGNDAVLEKPTQLTI
jgi:hypothetical protein